MQKLLDIALDVAIMAVIVATFLWSGYALKKEPTVKPAQTSTYAIVTMSALPIADMPARSGQNTFGKKSSPSQGKIKGFFKIAGSPAATASAQPQSMRRTGPCGSARE